MQKIVRFLTAGNVDDGKSTLIGRLLHDTNSLYQDQIDEVKNSTDAAFDGELDFSLFLDGLLSERAQKITIDVAYRYFTHQNVKFIIADAPGHEQYTRNMAVAAANSDSIIILIDASKGVKTQTIRHSYIAHLFGIKNVIVAVNKMDLVNFDLEVFDNIKKTYLEKISDLHFDNVEFVPIAAKKGINIAQKSDEISWYHGLSIIDYLLNFEVKEKNRNLLRLQIQSLAKHGNKRYYQGLLGSGAVRINDEIIAYPAKKSAKIIEINHAGSAVEEAFGESSISIVLDKEIDIDRGALLVNSNNLPYFSNHFGAHVIWFSPENFNEDNQKEFLIKINHNYFRARIDKINFVIDAEKLGNSQDAKIYTKEIHLNQIANINLKLASQTAFDLFETSNKTGSFLLINKETNETIACGVICGFLQKKDEVRGNQEEFLAELSVLVKKYFGDKNIDFSI
jgi:sulfate adenylyltransferase large subunit